MFNALAAGQMGGEAYHAYFMGRRPIDVAPFREAIDLFAEVVENYINADAGDDGFGWTNAAQALYDGDTAMFLHGDWVKGYLAQLGWKRGDRFRRRRGAGVVPSLSLRHRRFRAGARRPQRGGRARLPRDRRVAGGSGRLQSHQGSSPIPRRRPARRAGPAGRETLDDLQHAKLRMTGAQPPDLGGRADRVHARSRSQQATACVPGRAPASSLVRGFLLRHAVQRAEAPDQIDGVDADHLAVGEQRRRACRAPRGRAGR